MSVSRHTRGARWGQFRGQAAGAEQWLSPRAAHFVGSPQPVTADIPALCRSFHGRSPNLRGFVTPRGRFQSSTPTWPGCGALSTNCRTKRGSRGVHGGFRLEDQPDKPLQILIVGGRTAGHAARIDRRGADRPTRVV
jgi:hypothetical protein